VSFKITTPLTVSCLVVLAGSISSSNVESFSRRRRVQTGTSGIQRSLESDSKASISRTQHSLPYTQCTLYTHTYGLSAGATEIKQHIKVKVNAPHTWYRALGPEPIPMYKQSARRWLKVIHPAVGCHYFPPGLRLPPQPQSITALWPVPSYTARWQRHIGVNNFPKVITQRCLE